MYDIAIIGGGVNGCGIARDAAGRGLSVILAEKGDLASGTSSASTKLIHGGLRYLEHYEFRLVRESLLEREVLLAMAPHIIWPLRFVLPHHSALRPAWLIRIGLFLYDHLGGRKILPASHGIDLRSDQAGKPLKSSFTYGFEYSDCWVDDARLVVLNAMDARNRGAEILTRTAVTAARRMNGHWQVELDGAATGKKTIEARVLVNAAGPWVEDILTHRVPNVRNARMRLVKGSHIIVPKIFEHDKAYIFQNEDRRIVFAIPYEGDFTLIGTTDVDYQGAPDKVAIGAGEIEYLCRCASSYFRTPVEPDAVVWSYAGVRPLLDEGGGSAQEATRDFVLELDRGQGSEAALLNVCGGKITTYRRLAEAALDKLGAVISTGDPWTAGAPLPGGAFAIGGTGKLATELRSASSAIDDATARRFARTYGLLAKEIAGTCGSVAELGQHFGAGLSEREVRYLVDNEWAQTADDILWRRTKLGLKIDAAGKARLTDWLKLNATPGPGSAS